MGGDTGNGFVGGSDQGAGSLNGGGDGFVGGTGQGVAGDSGYGNSQQNGDTPDTGLGQSQTPSIAGDAGGDGQGETPTNEGGQGTGGNVEDGTGQAQTPDGQGQTPDGQGQVPDGQVQTPDGQGQTPDNQGQTPDGQSDTPANQGEGGTNNNVDGVVGQVEGNDQNVVGQGTPNVGNEGTDQGGTSENVSDPEGNGLDTPSQDENVAPTNDNGPDDTAAPQMRSMRMLGATNVNSQRTMLRTTTQNNDQNNNGQNQQWTVSYDYNAELHEADGDRQYAGVYVAAIDENKPAEGEATATPKTIGIPSIADKNLEDAPTTESPAIITGAAVGYETRDMGVTDDVRKSFTPQDAKRDAPYSYFNHGFMDEQNPDGTTHTKLTGFDGTYVITRIDLTNYLTQVAGGFGTTSTNNNNENTTTKDTLQGLLQDKFLHVKQEGNNALMVAVGIEEKETENKTTLLKTFSDAMGNKTGTYSVAALFDELGVDKDKPFFDVILFATAANVAGADAGKENVNNGDVKLSLYVDEVDDYNPDLKYDPQSTVTTHLQDCLNKFFNYDEAKKKDKNLYSALSTYTIKGSDLALETAVDEGNGKTTYWSLKKAIEKPYYDQEIDKSATDKGTGRTVKLMSEVAIVDGLTLKGQPDALKKRTLDVNSFDIQIAKNSAKDKSDYSNQITMENAWLKIADNSNTTGSELAIGNNAQMNVKKGGKLIIDKTCQLEIEWDGATQTPKEGDPTPTPDILNNGLLNIEAGGEVENNGIISIEGTEGKPYSETNKDQVIKSDKGYGELTIKEGAKLTNNGSMMVYGRLYNLGTIVNNGTYNDTIDSSDPDKGTFSYHKGITASWKDDVTQQNVTYGMIVNGQDRDGKTTNPNATIINNGDIVLNPGELQNYATLVMNPGSNIYACTATEALIPVEPPKQTEPTGGSGTGSQQGGKGGAAETPADPASTTPPPAYERRTLDPSKPSKILNNGTIIMDYARIATASIKLEDNGSFSTLTLTNEQVPIEGTGRIVYVEHPTPEPTPIPRFDPDRGRRDWDTDFDRGDRVDPDVPTRDPKRRSAIDVIIDGSPVKWAVDANNAGEATLVEIDNGVYQVTAMPAITLDEIVASINVSDPDVAEKIVELVEAGEVDAWWCAEVNGQTVRIMDIYGKLAPNVASVRYVVSPDGQTNIIVEFIDGTYAVIESFDELFIELEALAWS